MVEVDIGKDPRGQHYVFAHRLVPQLFFRNPGGMLALLGSPECPERILELWDMAGRGLEREHLVAFEGVSVVPTQLDTGLPIAVLVLPPPRRMTEAFIVGMAARLSDDDPPSQPRFFTLELGVDIATDRPRTVLCEWQTDGTHRNWGEGPSPDVVSFVEAVSQR